MLAVGISAGSAPAESLTDALASAYLNSDLLDQQQALLRATDEDVAQAVAALRPIIDYTGRATLRDTRAAHRLADGQPRHLAQHAALRLRWLAARPFEQVKETVLATRAALTDVEQQVLLRAVPGFRRRSHRPRRSFRSMRNNVRLVTDGTARGAGPVRGGRG